MKVIRGGANKPQQDSFPNLITLTSLYTLQPIYKDFEDELIASYAVAAWNKDEFLAINEVDLADVMTTVPQFLSEVPNKEQVFDDMVKAKNKLFPNTGLCIFSIEDNDDPNAKYEYKTTNRTTADMVVYYAEESKREMTEDDYLGFKDDEDDLDDDDENNFEYEDNIYSEYDGEINRSAIIVKRKPAFHDWLKFVLPNKDAGPEIIYLTNEETENQEVLDFLLPQIYRRVMINEFSSFIDDENDFPPITLENFHRYFYLAPHNLVYDIGRYE